MRDEVKAGERWAFDGEVTKVFDNMLERSIPQYQTMRSSVSELAVKFLVDDFSAPLIVDVGCSRGAAMAAIRALHPSVALVGLEVSPPMVEAAEARFSEDNLSTVITYDLREHKLPILRKADVFLCVLTLQFVPIEHRQRIVSEIFGHLKSGGAMILVEKVLGASSCLDTTFVDSYLEMKSRAGYTQEEIDRKKASLEGVLVPVTAKWNEELLTSAGFSEVDCFWRWMNFAGWIAIKR